MRQAGGGLYAVFGKALEGQNADFGALGVNDNQCAGFQVFCELGQSVYDNCPYYDASKSSLSSARHAAYESAAVRSSDSR